MFVDQFDDAEDFVGFAERSADPGVNFEIAAGFQAFGEARLRRRIFQQFGTGLLCDFGEQSFRERDARVVFDGGIIADFLGEVEILRAGVRQPEVAGAGGEDVANFSGDDGQEFAEFEGGSESAAEIVERGEAFQSGELRLAARFR